MLPTTIHEAPALDTFTSLADHQSQTPTSFYNAKPVLHAHLISAYATSSVEHISKLPIFNEARQGDADIVPHVETEEGNTAEKVRAVVEVFVTSEYLILFNHSINTGVSIPYPAISLHAVQRDQQSDDDRAVGELYMQLELSDPYGVTDDDDLEIVELSVGCDSTTTPNTGIQPLYDAVTNCSNLHPDPAMDDDTEMEDGSDSRIVFEGNVGYEGVSGLPGVQIGATDGGLPPPFPGSGGWITADNVNDFFDADGNWIGEGGAQLGEGAGRVRTHDEADQGVNGHAEDTEDNKRPRTD